MRELRYTLFYFDDGVHCAGNLDVLDTQMKMITTHVYDMCVPVLDSPCLSVRLSRNLSRFAIASVFLQCYCGGQQRDSTHGVVGGERKDEYGVS